MVRTPGFVKREAARGRTVVASGQRSAGGSTSTVPKFVQEARVKAGFTPTPSGTVTEERARLSRMRGASGIGGALEQTLAGQEVTTQTRAEPIRVSRFQQEVTRQTTAIPIKGAPSFQQARQFVPQQLVDVDGVRRTKRKGIPTGIAERVFPSIISERVKFQQERAAERKAEEKRLTGISEQVGKFAVGVEERKLTKESKAAQKRIDVLGKKLQSQIKAEQISAPFARELLGKEIEKETQALTKKQEEATKRATARITKLEPALEREAELSGARLQQKRLAATIGGTGVFGLREFVSRKVPGVRPFVEAITKAQRRAPKIIEARPTARATELIKAFEAKGVKVPKELIFIRRVSQVGEKAIPISAVGAGVAKGIVRDPLTTVVVGGAGLVIGGVTAIVAPPIIAAAGAGSKIAAIVIGTGKVTTGILGAGFAGVTAVRITEQERLAKIPKVGVVLSPFGAPTREEGLARFGETISLVGAGLGGAILGAKAATGIKRIIGLVSRPRIETIITEFTPTQKIIGRTKSAKAFRQVAKEVGITKGEVRRFLFEKSVAGKPGSTVTIERITAGKIAGVGKISRGTFVTARGTTRGFFEIPKADSRIFVKVTPRTTTITTRSIKTGKVIKVKKFPTLEQQFKTKVGKVDITKDIIAKGTPGERFLEQIKIRNIELRGEKIIPFRTRKEAVDFQRVVKQTQQVIVGKGKAVSRKGVIEVTPEGTKFVTRQVTKRFTKPPKITFGEGELAPESVVIEQLGTEFELVRFTPGKVTEKVIIKTKGVGKRVITERLSLKFLERFKPPKPFVGKKAQVSLTRLIRKPKLVSIPKRAIKVPRGALATVPSSVFEVAPAIASANISSLVVAPALATVARTRQITRARVAQEPIQIPQLGVTSLVSPALVSASISQQVLAPETALDFKFQPIQQLTFPITPTRFTIPEIVPPIPPIVPGVGFPLLGGGGIARGKKGRKRLKKLFKFQPSLVGIQTKAKRIKGRILTGLSVRGLPGF